MEVSLKQDSLAYQFGLRPAVLCRDVGSTPVSEAVKSMNKFMETGFKMSDIMCPSGVVTYEMMGNPEVDALVFYLMNHAVSVVRQKKHPYESLGEYLPIVEEYHNLLSVRSARMFFYLLLICTREARHSKDEYHGSLWQKFLALYGKSVMDFHSAIRGSGSGTAAERLRQNPPMTTLGKYTEFLADLFNKGKFSGGYGGVAWGKVAEVLRDFVHGKLSAEMMLDTAFTLCHNNGPIFNKGMLFQVHTSHIYKILDVQRSGQIPQMVANSETTWASTPEVKKVFDLCHNAIGTSFDGYVDWYLVEELGALHSYPTEKSSQHKLHGYPSKFKAKVEAEKYKKEAEAEKLAAEEKMWVVLTPILKVKKIEIKR